MRPELNSDALDALPVFPLPGVVLFPGAVIPLYVFEPRYRDMVRDVMQGSGFLALAHSRSEGSQNANGSTPFSPIAGVGSILASEELNDGCYNIMVRGVGRVELLEELPLECKYRRARAKALCDLTTARPKELIAGHRQLVSLCDRLGETLGADSRSMRDLVRACSEPGTCVDLILAAVVLNPDERQQLLETLDPADRIDRAIECVGRLLCERGTYSEVPN